MGITDRVKSWFGVVNPTIHGGIPVDWEPNFWQRGQDPLPVGECATVHACVDSYAQVIATCDPYHVRLLDTGGVQRIHTSALSRVLHNPNDYQTRSDFISNLVKNLLMDGNAYCLAYRNARTEVEALHIMPSRSTQPMIDSESGAVFYALGENPMLGKVEHLIPARDVFHLKLFTPRHPLVGVSPVRNAVMAVNTNQTISAHQAAFFGNASRPSGIITTDQTLSQQQMVQLRKAWAEQSTRLNSGGTPILHAGLKWQSLALNSQDAQLVDAFKMSIQDIARCYRVPLPLIGEYEHATFNNVEQLISLWLSTGLGFMLEHIELAFAKFFGLPSGETVQFDTEALMRTDFAGRIDALTKGVQGGLFTPNEARRKEGLGDVAHGDTPYLQQQMVPVGWQPEEAPVPAPANDEIDDETAKIIALERIKKAMTQ